MAFSAKQLRALQRKPDRRHIRTREANGRELTYLEGWYAISEANRIFGFDGWSRETVESRCVLARESKGVFLAVYIARVRITVQAEGTTLSVRVMAAAKAAVCPLARCMTLRLKPPRPMPRKGRWLHLASRLGLSFTGPLTRQVQGYKDAYHRSPPSQQMRRTAQSR